MSSSSFIFIVIASNTVGELRQAHRFIAFPQSIHVFDLFDSSTFNTRRINPAFTSSIPLRCAWTIRAVSGRSSTVSVGLQKYKVDRVDCCKGYSIPKTILDSGNCFKSGEFASCNCWSITVSCRICFAAAISLWSKCDDPPNVTAGQRGYNWQNSTKKQRKQKKTATVLV